MNWHSRYLQQAAWTRDLRVYLFEQAGLANAKRSVLEVGCGTGAVLCELTDPAAIHGLDLNPAALAECKIQRPAVMLTQGDAFSLPYPDKSFDIVYCHFLLLWVNDPLQVICEMARVGRTILALAEPDYSQRVDEPFELNVLGEWQAEALRRQGANPNFGGRLAETFYNSGVELIETGPIQGQVVMRSSEDWENEWLVIESDLEGSVTGQEIQKIKSLDQGARSRNERPLCRFRSYRLGKDLQVRPNQNFEKRDV
ncbi:class I SAM-dependent methyltransferase [Candidatus Villigracilis saccharophilus]|uniref:class I SAM-dependent methyltransferase n=1 Tax=Candidatus Villigracilis saccharophilus TaxID=3140684 RepID=UPI0031356ABF|nr:class I SAM-dependent methyltransferase [Anaerolineales bacterium]